MQPGKGQSGMGGEGRMVALVIAIAALLWVAVQWLAARGGWDLRYVLLADLAAGAAFIWALVVTWRIWRRQKPRRGN
jgi:type VI protein secretion system component VasK